MALVYAARDLALDRRVALKVLLPEYSDREELVARFLQEARLAAQLDNHPNIVRIYDIHQAGDVNYFTMSLLEGGTLTQRIEAQVHLTPQEAVSVALQVASALEHAHRKGIIHRDIKPENILFQSAGVVVVTDFGIAKASVGASLTRPGMVLGTPLYMSPEQIRGEELGPASDLYSLGVVFYEMLTGTPPFFGQDGATVMQQHLNEAPKPPHDLRSDVPRLLSDVVTRLLNKVPARRLSSGKELIATLEYLQSHPELLKKVETTASYEPATAAPGSPPSAVQRALTTWTSATPEEKVAFPEPESRPVMKAWPRNKRLWAGAGLLALIAGGWILMQVLQKESTVTPPARYTLYQQRFQEMASMTHAQKLVFLEDLRAKNPGDTSINTALAGLYYQASDFEKARDCYKGVLEKEPDNFEAGSDLASTLYQLHQVEEAIGCLENVLRSNPNHAKSLLNLGLILFAEKGDRQGAAKHWQRLLETNPDSPHAQQARQQLAALRKRG